MKGILFGIAKNPIGTRCYVRILKKSRCGQEQRVRGQECVWLIVINYHAATGTAGTGYKGD